MASYTSTFAQRLRKAIRVPSLGLASADALDSAALTLTFGTGAPSSTPPNGSVYLRTDGTDGDDSLYMRIAGAWVAMQCETT